MIDAPPAATEAELRDLRYSFATTGLRATGHTASDQVETVLYRLAASGSTRGIKAAREDGVVRPLLALWREETEAYCRAHGLDYRTDSTNPDTLRGLIRDEILPLLRRLHPAAEREHLRGSPTSGRASARDRGRAARAPRRPGRFEARRPRRRHPPRCASTTGSRSSGARSRWGPVDDRGRRPGLEVRARRPGDRLAGRAKKLQDVFVDAKVPRAERDAWPLVVRDDEVVAVPGIVEDASVRVKRA